MDYIPLYVRFLARFIRVRHPVQVVFDCSNGASGIALKRLFQLHPRVKAILVNGKPDGRFPGHGPNPLVPGGFRDLTRAVREHHADLGVAFDGDGDRVFFADEKGVMFRPGVAAALLAPQGGGNAVLTADVGFLAREELRARRMKIIDSPVGHTFVKQAMQKYRAAFGAEGSGHYYFKESFRCDSGILAAIRMMNCVSDLKSRNMMLGVFADSLPKYYSEQVNFNVKNPMRILKVVEKHYERQAKRISRLDGVRMEFGPSTGSGQDAWWFILRPSNTEPLLRLTMEAKDKKIFATRLKEITKIIKDTR